MGLFSQHECMCGNCVVMHVQQAAVAKRLAEVGGGERGGRAEGPAYDKDGQICSYSNREPESGQPASLCDAAERFLSVWHDTSVCELILVMFRLFVGILVHATSVSLWKMDVEAKDVCVSTVFGR